MLNISPSQIKTGRDCWRKFAFIYVYGWRAPSDEKQQFGTNTHAILEKWLQHAQLPDKDEPQGATALQGIKKGFLPNPDPTLLIEKQMKYALVPGANANGFIDCVDPHNVYDGFVAPLVLDHKTTSSLNWMMTPEQLSNDAQGVMYALWAMIEYNTPLVLARWVYYSASNPKNSPRKPSGCKKIEWLFDARTAGFREQVTRLLGDVEKACYIRANEVTPLDLPPSPEACDMYGGCPYRNIDGGCQLTAEEEVMAVMYQADKLRGK